MSIYHAIGLMSGSSLDGLDIAYCRFEEKEKGNWTFHILETTCIPYPKEWLVRFKTIDASDALSFAKCHADLGHYFGMVTREFILQHQLEKKVDLVASHGHTIFHFPENKFTCQIGEGAALNHRVQLPVICDFRAADIAAGGQGTPIVPIGDWHLFPEHPFLLNIGGIANISAKNQQKIVAFDICPANQVLNYLALKFGKKFDDRGSIAASGSIDEELLNQLNRAAYYQLPFPKSLDNSYSKATILPLLEKSQCAAEVQMRTYVEHIAMQINMHLQMIEKQSGITLNPSSTMLITGGGAFNELLVQQIEKICPVKIELPAKDLINYKEAMVIAFMGVLRIKDKINVLASVTGAEHDTIGGAVYASV